MAAIIEANTLASFEIALFDSSVIPSNESTSAWLQATNSDLQRNVEADLERSVANKVDKILGIICKLLVCEVVTELAATKEPHRESTIESRLTPGRKPLSKRYSPKKEGGSGLAQLHRPALEKPVFQARHNWSVDGARVANNQSPQSFKAIRRSLGSDQPSNEPTQKVKVKQTRAKFV